MFIDYLINKILSDFFKSLGSWLTILGGIVFFIMSSSDIIVRFIVVVLLLAFYIIFISVKNGYCAYKDIKIALEATVQDSLKVESIITDPLDRKSKHYIVKSLGLKNGQILVLQLKVNDAKFPLGVLRVKSTEGNHVHCAEVKIRDDARDHVNDETRMEQLLVTSAIMIDEIYE